MNYFLHLFCAQTGQCSIWQAPATCLLVPVGRHLCLFPLPLWRRWMQKHTANPVRTTETARVANLLPLIALVSWIVHATKHSCLLDCSCSFLRWHISLCWLSQALQECFFEFRALQNWLVCGHNKFQNKTEITLSNESISMKKGGTCMTKENKRHSKVPEECSLALAVPHLCLFLFPPWSCREIEKTARPVKMAAWSRKDSQSI